MQSAYQVPAEERRHLEYWTSSQWENDWWTEEQQSEQKKKNKGSKGKKRKAWLEAQISTLKAAGRWIGDEPNPRNKQQRLETVDSLRTLNYGSYGIFLIMGNAGFCPSTVRNPKP